jgi:nicotinamide mononucleotide transporter
LEITRVSIRTAAILSATLLVSSTGLAFILWRVRGSVPVLDSLTTMLSLIAQYMLNKKYFENWYVWMAADLIYIYLYLVRGLQLTALLYFAFLLLCILGLRSWREAISQHPDQSGLLSADSL